MSSIHYEIFRRRRRSGWSLSEVLEDRGAARRRYRQLLRMAQERQTALPHGHGGRQPYGDGQAMGELDLSAEENHSLTIITTEADVAQAPLNNRMVVTLKREDWPKWLSEETTSPAELQAMLVPLDPALLRILPVDRKVGNVRNDGSDLSWAIAH